MPIKRKDGRYQSSVTVENPITGERDQAVIYAYSLRDPEVERSRILAANISDFLEVKTFHHFARDFLRMKRDVDKLEESTPPISAHFRPAHPAANSGGNGDRRHKARTRQTDSRRGYGR